VLATSEKDGETEYVLEEDKARFVEESAALLYSPDTNNPSTDLQTPASVDRGKILIIIVKGEGFKIKRKVVKSDIPDFYCKVEYRSLKWETLPVKDDNTPVWPHAQECEYDMSEQNQEIKIDVFDKNRRGADDYYGQANASISKILNATKNTLELEVMKVSTSYRWSSGMTISVKCIQIG